MSPEKVVLVPSWRARAGPGRAGPGRAGPPDSCTLGVRRMCYVNLALHPNLSISIASVF